VRHPTDEDIALSDLHALYTHWQHRSEIARLPFAARRAKTVEWFRQTHGRLPHPIPESVRSRALSVLGRRRAEYVEEVARARKEVGPTERITAGRVRDLTRRARARGLIEPGQRPRAYAHTE
jgi:hypothetical protein